MRIKQSGNSWLGSAAQQCRVRTATQPRMQRTAAAAIERLSGLSKELENRIDTSLGSCLTETNLAFRKLAVGKVRDTYDLGDKLLVVTTDRQSAFDRLLASIPFKGQILNQTSAWWMERTKHIASNALLCMPDPNATLMRKCQVIPVEIVVRGYMTGSTSTSLWTHYSKGAREYCGNKLGNGMRKNDRLEQNIITPTTKAAVTDVPISPTDIVAQRLMTDSEWKQIEQSAMNLFAFGQQQAAERGLILVDTKYEFGKAEDGTIMLIDEIHTPDSSRYWISNSYEQRHAEGSEPQNIDKEFLRLWFAEHCDPYKDEVLPEAPSDLVAELSKRYILLYEMITREAFQPAPLVTDINQRIANNLQKALQYY